MSEFGATSTLIWQVLISLSDFCPIPDARDTPFLTIMDRVRWDDQTRNALTYDLPTTVKGSIKVGNVYFPALEYNSSNDGFVRMYNAFLEANQKTWDVNASTVLDFDKWKQIYPVLYFDCSNNDNQFENTAGRRNCLQFDDIRPTGKLQLGGDRDVAMNTKPSPKKGTFCPISAT